jgi:NAD(P)-dependent dehydrogenase (short-subunit alcohol dehydrogenase family)
MARETVMWRQTGARSVGGRPLTVLITGCSSGFGRAAVRAFAHAGFVVLATARDLAARPGLPAELQREGPGRVLPLSLDVTDAAEREAVAAFVRARPGGLDCLVNNAGYGVFGALEDCAPDQLRRQMEVNFFGAALLTQALLPSLRAARGRVINVSSMLGSVGFPLTGAYCASKFALEGLTESLAHELRPHGVGVALVEPGGYPTRFASSVEWAAGSVSAGSAYAARSAGYRRRLETFDGRRRGSSPDVVARVVVGLALARRLPLRRRVGRDARLVHVARRVLPEGLWHAVYAWLCARALPAAPSPGVGAAAPRVP